MKKLMAWLLLVCLCLTLCSCDLSDWVGGTREPDKITPTPAPVLTNEPAGLYSGVMTDQRVVALVLEGYTDETSMMQLIDLIKAREIPCVWFVSGVTAFEFGSVVRYAAAAGIELGNYTVSAEKEMETRSAGYLVHQFERTQQLIFQNTGKLPDLGRCNGTVYTPDVLRAVAAGGLDWGVDPTLFLNHRSFRTQSDAQVYMDSMIRGAVISVKLGQELDEDEYGDQGEMLDERPAVDPSPSIANDLTMQAAKWTYQDIVPVVTWLLDALEANGYDVVSLEALQQAAIPGMDEPRTLTEEEEALLAPAAYQLPLTDKPLGTARQTETDGLLFIGNSVTLGLADYTAWRRQTEADFLQGVQFIGWDGLTVESALSAMEEGAVLREGQVNLAEAAAAAGAKRICLMLQFDTDRACYLEEYLTSYLAVIQLIREKNPEAEIIVQSVTPGIKDRIGTPDNAQIFRYNLLLKRMCLQHGIPFADVAWALRDAEGCLKAEYCIDPQTYGLHLSDAGCEAWLASILDMPEE